MTPQQETLYDAVAKLIKAKGRFHTEPSYAALVTAFDAETVARRAPAPTEPAVDASGEIDALVREYVDAPVHGARSRRVVMHEIYCLAGEIFATPASPAVPGDPVGDFQADARQAKLNGMVAGWTAAGRAVPEPAPLAPRRSMSMFATLEDYRAAQASQPTSAEELPKPRGWLAGHVGDGVEDMYLRREDAQRECDSHNAYERSRPDFDADSLRSPEPVYAAQHAFAPTSAEGKDSERPRWQPITAPGQVNVGDRLRFTIGDAHYNEVVKVVLRPGTDQEELIYNKRSNYYVITKNILTEFGGVKDLTFLRASTGKDTDKEATK